MIFAMLSPDEVDYFWDKARHYLAQSFIFSFYTHTVNDYYDMLKNQSVQLWVALDKDELKGAVITSIDPGTVATACTIRSLGGKDLKDWAGLMDEHLSNFARANGCAAIEAITRKGFNHYVPDFLPDGVVHVKLLGENKNG